ncbi:MAG TPA: AI-2E family transporter [Steroidobacteraceae bacterium]|nr:AI-2E family transporter [Steroidobacteraceae bacterium]
MAAASSFYPRVFALVVAAGLGYALVLIFLPFLAPIAWAAFLAFLLQPVNVRLRARLGTRGRAAGLLTVLTPIVLVLPLAALSFEFVTQISALVANLQQQAQQHDIKTISDLQRFPLFWRADAWLHAHTGVSAEQIQTWILSQTRLVLEKAAGLGGALFVGALGTFIAFMIMLFVLFYLLSDGDSMCARAIRLIPLDELRKARLVLQLSEVTRAIVFGTVMNSAVQGVLLGIGWAIAGLPAPVVFGVLVALITMLPVGGSMFAWIPALGWLIFQRHWGLAIFLLAWGLVLGALDNVLRPWLISGRARISGLAVFIGVLGGVSAFGAIGLIAGPVVLSLVIALIEFAEESRAAPQRA